MKTVIAFSTAALLCAGAAHAEELFVNIHSGSAMAQGAGLVLAGQALEQKASARVLLCDKATDLIPGVTPAKPAEVAAHLLKPGVNSLAF